MTKLGAKRVREIRTRGGNKKFRALRLDTGNFSWGSEAISHPSRILNVVYNASNNELVRTNTLVKGAIIQIDAHPFLEWYNKWYGVSLGRKDTEEVKMSRHQKERRRHRRKEQVIDPQVAEQLKTGRLYACISSRPGQSGRADGYILEGEELAFYKRKLKTRR